MHQKMNTGKWKNYVWMPFALLGIAVLWFGMSHVAKQDNQERASWHNIRTECEDKKGTYLYLGDDNYYCFSQNAFVPLNNKPLR